MPRCRTAFGTPTCPRRGGIFQQHTGTFAQRITMGYPSCIKLSFLHGLLSSPEAWSSTRVVWGFFWRSPRQGKTTHSPQSTHCWLPPPKSPLMLLVALPFSARRRLQDRHPHRTKHFQGAAKWRSGHLVSRDLVLTHLPTPLKQQALLQRRQRPSSPSSSCSSSSSSLAGALQTLHHRDLGFREVPLCITPKGTFNPQVPTKPLPTPDGYGTLKTLYLRGEPPPGEPLKAFTN